MRNKVVPSILLVGLLALGAAVAEKAPTAAAVVCKCECRNCPPKGVLSKNKADEWRYRRCYVDANKNGVCDNSSKDGRKCKNDCVRVTEEDAKRAKKKVSLACANCPCAANCSKCVTVGK